jgi:hypothetical protein
LIDVRRRVDGKKGESHSGGYIHIGRSFQMIGVGSDTSCPSSGLGTLQGIVHDLARRALRSRHFANRLLRKYRFDGTSRPFHGSHMAGSCQAYSISEAKAWGQPKCDALA